MPRSKRFKALGFVVSCALGAAIFSAAGGWDGSSFVHGKAKTGTVVSLVTDPAYTNVIAPGSSFLYPGGDGDLSIRVKNTNSFDLYIHSITTPAAYFVKSGVAGCDSTINVSGGGGATNGITFNVLNLVGANAIVIPGTNNGGGNFANYIIPGVVHAGTGLPNACQGVTLDISDSATPSGAAAGVNAVATTSAT